VQRKEVLQVNAHGMGDQQSELPEAVEPNVGKKDNTNSASIDSVFSGGSEMAGLMRTLDWSQTAVGPVSSWPQSLKTAVRIVLASRFAMFVWWGREFVNLYNDSYRTLLGAKHPAALGKPAREVWAEIWDQIGPRADAVLLRGESTYDEALLLLPERHGYPEETYFTFSYSPLPDDEGNVGGLFCAVTEETQRVIGERRLKLLRETAAAMAESRTPSQVWESAARCLSNGRRALPFTLIYVLDADGKTLTKAAETGFTTAHPAAPVSVSVDDPDEAVWPFRRVIKTGQAILVENLSSRFTGLPKGQWNDEPKCAILLPIAQQGQPRLSGVFVAGLNPYRRFDDGYRGFVSLLSNQIGSALANAVAYETERRRAETLAELDLAKTKFFSNVSHEFRTPLSLLLGPLEEVLSEGPARLSPGLREQLVVAHRNALRLLKLVNTLLDFSRIEAGRLDAVYEPTELCKLTQEVSSVFRSAMEKAGLAFSVECEPIQERVYVDHDMWEKIVLNLLSNAFKFTFEGSVVVRLRVVGNGVQLSVTDTGTGIPKEEIPRVFERFHRVESSRARTFEGTGIGLALVQELTKFHGGTVEVTSSLERGSTFTVTIPLGKAHLPANRVQAKLRRRSSPLSRDTYVEEAQHWLPQKTGAAADEPVASMPPSATSLSGEQQASQRELILLADDNADMREYVAHLLRDRYRVHAVRDGQEAVEATRRLRPDLVLADVMMPALDGFGLVDAIRKDASLSSTPVILLSARAGEESRVEGLHAGASDYLVKPFTARELLARVGAHLAMSRIQKEQIIASQRLAAIVESADDAIISKDLNGIVTSWNRAAEQMFGYRAEEMIGRSIMAIIPPDLQADEPRILETIGRGERINHFETVRVAKSGKRIDVSLTVSPVKNENGQIVGAAKIARDITQDKQTRRALRISERLASVSRLAATIAHEINNPLEAATNLVYLAKDRAISHDQRDFLAATEEELARISHLTKQTLGFYRETKEAEPIRISPILDQLISVFAARTRNKSVDIRREIRGDPEVYAVADEIRQLITNLLSNSIDAVTRGGQIRLRVSPATEWNRKGRSGVRLTVADSGSGIPKAVRSELFEPFFTTKKEAGTGLGLWLSKGIVERHHGSIRVKSRSEPGNGWTVFSVFLPSSVHRLDVGEAV
jgi:PAS domain S-box-containing protein